MEAVGPEETFKLSCNISSFSNSFALGKNPDRGRCQMFPGATGAETKQRLNICGGVPTGKGEGSTIDVTSAPRWLLLRLLVRPWSSE